MKFTINGMAHVPVFITVEAPTAAAALAKAEVAGLPSLCHQCGGDDGSGEWCLTDGLGETVLDLVVEDADGNMVDTDTDADDDAGDDAGGDDDDAE